MKITLLHVFTGFANTRINYNIIFDVETKRIIKTFNLQAVGNIKIILLHLFLH